MKETMKILVVHPDASIPIREHEGDAGYDLFAVESKTIPSTTSVAVPTGLAVEIPKGFVGLVCPKSGLALRYGITICNSPGVIDSGYRGEIVAIVQNTSNNEYFVKQGDPIAQLLIVPVYCPDIEVVLDISELSKSQRGDEGFGSTYLK